MSLAADPNAMATVMHSPPTAPQSQERASPVMPGSKPVAISFADDHNHDGPSPASSPAASASASPSPASSTTTAASRPRALMNQQQPASNAAALRTLAEGTSALHDMQSNLVVQDRIIAALETDNQRLLQENKALRTKLRDAQMAAAAARPVQNETAASAPPSRAASAVSGLNNDGPTTAATMMTAEEAHAAAMAKLSPEQQLSVAALQQQLAQARADMDAERRDMARKISWYIDRQEVGAAQDALIAEQQQQIRDLRLQVADLDAQLLSAGHGSSSGRGGADKDKATIRTQARRIAELEDALRNRHPDSLAELIRATRPPLTESAEFRRMKAQLEEAQHRLQEQDENAQRAIAQLRVESDALRAQYAKRLEKVGEEMKLRLQATQTRKAKELQKQLEDTRRFYSDKVKDLEAQLAGYRRGDHITERRGTSAARSSSAPGRNGNSQNDDQQQQQQQQQQMHPSFQSLSYPFPTPMTMNPQQQQHQSDAAAPSTARSAASSARSRSPPRNGNNNNNGGNTTAAPAAAAPPAFNISSMPYPPFFYGAGGGMMMATGNNNGAPVMIPVPDPGMQQRLWFLETRVKSLEEENRFLQKTATESVLSTGAAAAVQSQLGESHREVVTLQRLLRDAQEQQRRTVEELDERLHKERQSHGRELERLAANHRDEMKALQTRCDAEVRLRSDSVASRQLMAFSSGLANVMGEDLGSNCSTKELRRYLLLLAERVHCLERQLAAAESEAARQLAEVRRIAEWELQVEKQKMGVALKQKNAEIDTFRLQLDQMMEKIAMLRKK